MDSPGPRLPWEVIERAIDDLSGHRVTLQSLALTCSNLLPRTRLVMFAHVRFESRDHVFAFVDFLQENPHLLSVVRSITVWPRHLAPFPLLSILPNLSAITFEDPDGPPRWSARTRRHLELGLHQSSLTCLQRFGTSIRTVHLSHLRFKTCMSFVRLLLAFVHVTHLICHGVLIGETDESGEEPQPSLPDAIKRQLSRRIKLEALTVDYDCLIASHQATNLGRLLLDSSNSVTSTIKSLTLEGNVDHELLHKYRCEWSLLRSLTLKLQYSSSLDSGVEVLEGFRKCPLLTNVTLEWRTTFISDLILGLLQDDKKTEKLEHALLAFSQPRFICSLYPSLSPNGSSLWPSELGKHLPALSQRGAVTLQSRCLGGFLGPGHEGRVRALAFSPDSKWVASASSDCTIILWDADNRTIAQQWVAHGYRQIEVLAFSPDSQYIVSGAWGDNTAEIWDLSREPRKVATLGEGDPHVPDMLQPKAGITQCAWSPDGRTIATGSLGGTVQLWDAQTFGQQALHKLGGAVADLTFSPNGCWLICRSSSTRQCSVLNVSLSALHKFLNPYGYVYLPTDDPLGPPSIHPFRAESAACDPTGTRLAVVSGEIYYIIDVETGNALLVLDRDERKDNTRDISFSPDGRLVLGVAWNTCYIWDASTGTTLSQLEGHRARIAEARFSPCGKYIASGSADNTVRLWRTSNGSCVTTLTGHRNWVTHVAFSPDGKTLSSADNNGRVIIRRMRDIIPPIDTQDDPTLITPSLPPVVDPTPHPFPRSDGRAGIFPDEETDRKELRPTPQREDVGEPEERRIDEDAASSGRPGPQQSTAGAFFGRDEEDEESAVRDSPVADHQRAVSAARSPSGDSLATTSGPIAVDGNGSTSSARRSSVTIVRHEVIRVRRRRRRARKALQDANGAVPMQSTSAGQHNKKRVEGTAVDSGPLGLQQPIAGVSIQRDEDGDENVQGNSPTVDGANVDARASPEVCEAVVEDLSTDAIRPSLPTPTVREASTSGGQPPSCDTQADANSEGQVPATPAVGQENATCSDGAMAGDVRAGLACRSSSRDSTTSSARLSSLTPAEHEASRDRGQPPTHAAREDADSESPAQGTPAVAQENATCSDSAVVGDRREGLARRSSSGHSTTSSARLSSQPPSREASEDANALAQAQAGPSVEQKDPEGSAASPIASPMDRAANEPERRGVVDICATRGRTSVPEGGSGQRGKSVTRVLKAVGMNVRRTAQQVASGSKKCWAKLTALGAKVAQRRRDPRASASIS